MSDETTTTDHSETIRRARERMGQYTPGPWYQGTSGHPPSGHISYIAQTGEAWRGTLISGDYDEALDKGAPWLHIPNVADRDLITDAPDLNAALVALADERDALRARVDQIKSIRVVRDKSISGDYLHGFEEALSVALTILSGGA